MQNDTMTWQCDECGFRSTEYRTFVFSHPFMPVRCQNANACGRRQKRNVVANELANPKHPIDRFSISAISLCGSFLIIASLIGLSYLLFGV